MARINRIVPFGLWPANWGLVGSRRDEAEAEYYYSGEDLSMRLIEIRHEANTPEFHQALLNHNYKYHHIGEFDYGLGLINTDTRLTPSDRERLEAKYLHRFGKLTPEELEYRLFELSYEVKDTEAYMRERLKLDVRFAHKTQEQADRELLDLTHGDKESTTYQIAQCELEYRYGHITEKQRDKQVATLNKEPWFDLLGADKDIRGDTTRMAIELDWNDYFIEFLESKGWTGLTDDAIVDAWFEEAMRQMLFVDEDGEPTGEEADPLPMATRRKRDDGLTEYS